MSVNLDRTKRQKREEAIQGYMDAPEKQHQLYRRSLIIVVIAQLFGGAGLAAGVTVGALIAQDMLRTDSFAGIPAALFTMGSASSAFLVGWLCQRYGRRAGLATGFFAGGIGAIGIVFAAVLDNLALLFASMLIYGAGTSTNLQARYAGTDLAKPEQLARAISISMVATTFGAVAGPNLVDVMGRFAASLGIPALAGPFILAAAAFLLAGLIFWALLRPDPFIVAKAIAKGHTTKISGAPDANQKVPAIHQRGIIVGTSVMVLTQIVMVAIMTMTPVHMKHHGHGLGEVGMVIGIHIAAMFLPSLATGLLVDWFGSTTMSYVSGVTLLLAGIVAAAAPGDSMFLLIVALALLGLGWNFGLISGTAQIIEATPIDTRAKTQGTVDVLIALAGASGGALSGVVAANSSYTILALAGGLLSLLLIPIVIWSRNERSSHA